MTLANLYITTLIICAYVIHVCGIITAYAYVTFLLPLLAIIAFSKFPLVTDDFTSLLCLNIKFKAKVVVLLCFMQEIKRIRIITRLLRAQEIEEKKKQTRSPAQYNWRAAPGRAQKGLCFLPTAPGARRSGARRQYEP
jgi:hypothetical protein